MKQVEAGALLLAGIVFGWWQLRDVKRAQAESARQRSQAASGENSASAADKP